MFTIKYFVRYSDSHVDIFKKYIKRVINVFKIYQPKDKINNPFSRTINNIHNEIGALGFMSSNLKQMPSLDYRLRNSTSDFSEIRIELPTKSRAFDKINFNEKHIDREDYFYINRFKWLFEILLIYPELHVIKYSFKIINLWINNNGSVSDDPKFESYSISERIISWIFFIMFVKKHIDDNEIDFNLITKSIEKQTLHLINNLEYNGDETNNHILNNARALYIVGKVFNNKFIEKLGVDIFKSENKNMIIKGALQEGSSHYQLLITKNIIEMCMVAELYGDQDFKGFLESLINKMLVVCSNLFGNFKSETFPIFGDISPDISPEWFSGFPFQINITPSRWYKLFNYTPTLMDRRNIFDILPEKHEMKWHRIANGKLEVWINLRNGYVPCHGHNDNGTIVIFFSGKPIIIDLGLVSFLNSDTNKVQKNGNSHNMPIINGFSVDVPHDSLVFGLGMISKVCINSLTRKSINYSVEYANNKIHVTRNIDLEMNCCQIQDSIDKCNLKNNKYIANWHFNNTITKRGDCMFSDKDYLFTFIPDPNCKTHLICNDFKSPKYGTYVKTSSMKVEAIVPIQTRIITEISFKKTEHNFA